MEGGSDRPSKIPIPLRLPVHPKPQTPDERMDQMDSTLTQISESLLELQKRLAKSSVTDERNKLKVT
jgi:hypothetical protein